MLPRPLVPYLSALSRPFPLYYILRFRSSLQAFWLLFCSPSSFLTLFRHEAPPRTECLPLSFSLPLPILGTFQQLFPQFSPREPVSLLCQARNAGLSPFSLSYFLRDWSFSLFGTDRPFLICLFSMIVGLCKIGGSFLPFFFWRAFSGCLLPLVDSLLSPRGWPVFPRILFSSSCNIDLLFPLCYRR